MLVVIDEEWIKFGVFNEARELIDKDMRLKTIPQGAATTVWAAIGKDLEGKGGKYLEDVKVSTSSTQSMYTYTYTCTLHRHIHACYVDTYMHMT